MMEFDSTVIFPNWGPCFEEALSCGCNHGCLGEWVAIASYSRHLVVTPISNHCRLCVALTVEESFLLQAFVATVPACILNMDCQQFAIMIAILVMAFWFKGSEAANAGRNYDQYHAM